MRGIILILLLLTTRVASAQQASEAPAPPERTIPPINDKTVRTGCIDCGRPFTLAQHEAVLKRFVDGGILTHEYLAELRKAMYWQDSIHQFESKAHFDNCAFDEAAAYVGELASEAGRYAAAAEKFAADGKRHDAQKSVLQAFFVLGQALHAIQDFYAHSNYVELERDRQRPLRESRPLPVWTSAGRATLRQLATSGKLHSGYVIWGLGKRCPDGVPTHGEMSKDSEKGRGAEHVPHWENQTLHRAARRLATDASLAFLTYAYRRWPYLAQASGRDVLFDVFQDRRRF